MTIYLIRASHANEFELQNYAPLARKFGIRVVTSLHPLSPVSLPTIPLWSPTDLPNFPFRRQLLNRLIGGEQWLPTLKNLFSSHYHNSNYGSKRSKLILHTAETYTPYTHQAVELRKQGMADKLVCTCWETIPHNNEKFARLRHWKQEAYRYVDLFHTPTERAKQALITEGVPTEKIVVIPYGVDQTRFRPVKVKKNHKRKRILTVARLVKEKGMEIINSLALALPKCDFVVVGQGSYRFTAPNVKVKSVPYSSIHKEYQSADLFLFPSLATPTWEEQYGMALIEAMASGLPIITSQTGAIPEVIGKVGKIVTDNKVKNYLSSMQTILSEPGKLEAMSHSSSNRAKLVFDLLQTSQKLARIYT